MEELPREVIDDPFLETFQVRLKQTEQPDLSVDVPSHCRGVGLHRLFQLK